MLLLRGEGVVKTVKFGEEKYIGDPRNAVRLYNDMEVDELMILDINATVEGRVPNYELLEEIVTEAFMPISYGGGVTGVDQMRKLYYLGVEKVAINAAAIKNPSLIQEAAEMYGRQSVVVSVDVKKNLFGKYEVVYNRGQVKHKEKLADYVRKVVDLGAGEIVINSVDKDGTRTGFDLKLVESITSKVDVPVIAVGGAGSLSDIHDVVHKSGASAAAAGSLFVYHGKHKAVLINYPSQAELKEQVW